MQLLLENTLQKWEHWSRTLHHQRALTFSISPTWQKLQSKIKTSYRGNDATSNALSTNKAKLVGRTWKPQSQRTSAGPAGWGCYTETPTRAPDREFLINHWHVTPLLQQPKSPWGSTASPELGKQLLTSPLCPSMPICPTLTQSICWRDTASHQFVFLQESWSAGIGILDHFLLEKAFSGPELLHSQHCSQTGSTFCFTGTPKLYLLAGAPCSSWAQPFLKLHRPPRTDPAQPATAQTPTGMGCQSSCAAVPEKKGNVKEKQIIQDRIRSATAALQQQTLSHWRLRESKLMLSNYSLFPAYLWTPEYKVKYWVWAHSFFFLLCAWEERSRSCTPLVCGAGTIPFPAVNTPRGLVTLPNGVTRLSYFFPLNIYIKNPWLQALSPFSLQTCVETFN